ncbi:hypothetical protein J5Y09_17490 [Roseomonas sp. PWR1]|uniref:Uncharacterized protein n=1 Tax=Roseomonas nitratireducens TaxID=2820810 RepID=A0ABS4AWI2_9PROT|nr:hypothetical protein [Neoroseomonas nitratireducens]MBP0465725.1 hypothetical protein [Neoroseomonas nitratireducens]
MLRATIVTVTALGFALAANAQVERSPTAAPQPQVETITDPDAIAARLRFWATDSGAPVYYGEVRNVDARSRRVLGHYQCLAIAFIRYEAGVFHYYHKMWARSPDGSCRYDDQTSHPVGNRGLCVRDSDAAGPGRAPSTRRISKDNLDWQNGRFRTIDTRTRVVGETAECVPPRGVGAGLFSLQIVGDRFRLITTRPLSYELNMAPQDPRSPPSAPVF